jgi:phosphohistidine phosphatase
VRRLTLLRHGQAEAEGAQGDAERALTRRGDQEAWSSAARLAALDLIPQRILASTAIRTRQTAQIAQSSFGLPSAALTLEPRLYLADAFTLLEAIAGVSAELDHLLVVGHNPGLSELVHLLAPRSSFGSLETGAWATLEIQSLSQGALDAVHASFDRAEAPAR